jgi:DNA-binding transcriptional LysR family regulator
VAASSPQLVAASLTALVVVARERDFARAAQAEDVTVRTLRRRLRRLEDAVGVPLLRDSTRTVELTPAGETLAQAGEQALLMVDRAICHARRAAGLDVAGDRAGLPVPTPGHRMTQIATAVVYAVIPDDHPAAEFGTITPGDLDGLTLAIVLDL